MTDTSSFMGRFNLVRQIPIFAKLNWFDIQRVANKAIVAEYKKGDIICSEGTPPDFLYCLVSGRVHAVTQGRGGKREHVDFIHRGMHFGIISVLTGENHSMTFEVMNDAVVIKIPKDDFHRILKAIPHLGVEFSHILSKRVRRNVKGGRAFESMIISVYSPEKGAGSSTYAYNLAIAIEKETHKKVILVHIEPQQTHVPTVSADQPVEKPASGWYAPSVALADVAGDHIRVGGYIFHEAGLPVDLLSVHFDEQQPGAPKQIAQVIASIVGDYHYVIVDLPNRLVHVVEESLTQADCVHLVSFSDKENLTLLRGVIDRTEVILKESFREDKVRVIIRDRPDNGGLSLEEVGEFLDYPVYAGLPYVDESAVSEISATSSVRFVHPDQASTYMRIVSRIGRQIGGVSLGLVLGGGAALGISHIGVLRVLEEEGIPIDIVAGSSMGALIGSLWVTGNSAQQIATIASTFKSKRNVLQLLDPVFPISGFIGGRFIRHWLRRHLKDHSFYSTVIPFRVVAYDLRRREELVLQTGSLVDAVHQSIAIPGVFEPIRRKGRVVIDGGVMNPLPTNVLAAAGIKKMIAVNVLKSPRDVSYGVDMAEQRLAKQRVVSFWQAPIQFTGFHVGQFFEKFFQPTISDVIVLTLQAAEYVIAEQGTQQADVNIHPELAQFEWFELYRVDELIKAGEDAARKALPEIRALMAAECVE